MRQAKFDIYRIVADGVFDRPWIAVDVDPARHDSDDPYECVQTASGIGNLPPARHQVPTDCFSIGFPAARLTASAP